MNSCVFSVLWESSIIVWKKINLSEHMTTKLGKNYLSPKISFKKNKKEET